MKTPLILFVLIICLSGTLTAQEVKVNPTNPQATAIVPATANPPATTNLPATTTTTTTTTTPTSITTTTVVTTSVPSAVVPVSVAQKVVQPEIDSTAIKHKADSASLVVPSVADPELVTQTNGKTSKDSVKIKKPRFWVGLKFGLDISSTTNSFSGISDQLKGNYQAGILFQFGRTLFFQPEFYYSSYKIDETNSLEYIKIPVMVGLKFLDLGLFSLHIMGGPSCSILLNKPDNSEESGSFAWQVGAGIDVLGFITADLRYTLNNKSVSEQITEGTSTPTKLNLTFGLKFR